MKSTTLLLIALCLLTIGCTVTVEAGFGCPLSAPQCHRHCRSIGRKGGYCAGFLRTTCTCYRK